MKITSANVDEVRRRIYSDPCTSYWLKNALDAAAGRDILDAANDAELLSRILTAMANKAVGV